LTEAMSAHLQIQWEGLGAIVGTEHVRSALPSDAVDGVEPRAVVEPGSAAELARVLSYAGEGALSVSPRGGGTKLDWGNAPQRVDLVLSTRRLDSVIEHAWGDMTATVGAGCTVGRFQSVLAEQGQRLAVDPLWPARATVGGILATNDGGALRAAFGSLRDQVIGVTIALADGTVAKSGGRVVKNVAGYDLPKLLTGSLGTLGVICEATFRLYPLPREERTLSFSAPAVDVMNRLVLAVLDSPLVVTGLQICADECTPAPTVNVRLEGAREANESQERRLVELGRVAGVRRVDAPLRAWEARERVWHGETPALVCKFSVLPTGLGGFCDLAREVASSLSLGWIIVAQALGVGLLRLEGGDEERLVIAIKRLRSDVEKMQGSLVVLHCPPAVKARVDVWGDVGDALPLMRRVKAQFDPAGMLNPGRFVGGI
jgi:glycolate oxidase FAD binding subunit